MTKLIAIMRREYLARVRSKWFIFSTLFAPILIVGIGVVPALIVARQAAREMEISVIDESGLVLAELLKTSAFREGHLRLRPSPPGETEAVRAQLRNRVQAKQIDGYLYVPADILESGQAEFWGSDVSSPLVARTLRTATTTAVRRVQARALGLDESAADRLTRRIQLATYRVTEEGVQRERGQTWVAAQLLGLGIYVMVILYGAMMLRAAVAEKSNKMVEIILSSVRPWQLMLGKTLGVGAVGLTQLGVWLGMLSIPLIFAGSARLLADSDLLKDIPVGFDTLLLFLGLFLTGYFLYAGMYASVGAIANSEQEAAQLQLPVTLLAVIPAVALAPVLNDAASTTSMVLSWIPFFAPVIFIARYVLGVTRGWEIPIVFALQIAAIFLVGWIGGRIYRVGLLMTGKRPTLAELVRWVRYG